MSTFKSFAIFFPEETFIIVGRKKCGGETENQGSDLHSDVVCVVPLGALFPETQFP